MTQAEATDADQEPTTGYAWCRWHGGYSRTARLVGAVEQGSGPGLSLFACKDCREKHGLAPLADQP